ncbi:MAG: efflux RND transporter permease subunit [bacterium]|nr:efflux RND transporter permease subunit [bacterium]
MRYDLTTLALRYRPLVLLLLLALIAGGVYSYSRLPVDAFPDISPIMVPVFAEAHGMAPEEVERLITYPIETAMNGLPGVTQIKSTSAFGMAVIYVYFKDDVDIYFARQLVAERLNAAQQDLPEMHEAPGLGPISTGLGQIFIYYLTLAEGADTEGKEADVYLREINDWVVKYQLKTVPGVTDILSIGGHVLQYQIRVDPYALSKYDLALDDLVESVRANNRNAGGQFLLLGSEEFLVRGIGLLEDLDQMRQIPIETVDGVPIHLGDVAEVVYGREIRRGVVSLNGEGEVVSGIVLQLYGENTSNVIERLYDKIPELQAALPDGVELHPYYEQAELVQAATWTVKKSLLIGAMLVLVTLVVFLGSFRTALIPALALPVSALIAIICMRVAGISANLMSLGGIAIAIGMLGDGTIVMVENIYRHLTTRRITDESGDMPKVVRNAANEVGRPIIFSILIIVIVFLPIFSLENVEGKMFRPMAFTLVYALLGSIAMAVIVAPVLSSYLLRGGVKEWPFLVKLKSGYRRLLNATLQRTRIVVGVSLVAVVLSLVLVPHLGTEFIPTLEEGSILIGVTMAPSISLEEGVKKIQSLERAVMKFDEVEEVLSRVGRPEAGSHPHPVNYAEVHLSLKPLSEWRDYGDKQELTNALNERLSSFPGVQLNFTQPIQNAFDELLSGIKAQLAIKVYGEDLEMIRSIAGEVREAIEDVPGLVDLSLEQNYGQPQLQVVADRNACARYGVDVSEILEIVELAVGGEVIDDIYVGARRFGIHVRYQAPFRDDPQAIADLLVPCSDGARVPLGQVAEISLGSGPVQINREKNQRRWVVQGNVRGRDLGSVVADIRARVDEKVELPAGVFIEYGGQFANQQRAMGRLAVIVPIVLLLVLVLLSMTYESLRMGLLIFLTIPLALVGGVLGLFLSGEYLSVPAAVGFIALFGIAVQNGVVLVGSIRQAIDEGREVGAAVVEGAVLRVRPVLMTAATTMLGLLPLLLATGLGAEVQRPLAVVVVAGLASATFSTLFVVPALFKSFNPRRESA